MLSVAYFGKFLFLCYNGLNMDHRELVNIGLTDKEAKVYLAALELGKSPVQKIAQKAGVNRATTYVIIEGMMKKGLMSSYHEDKKQFFFAESPEKLSILFKNQEQELNRKQEYLEKLLPELKGLNVSKEGRPVVRYFEGKEGMRAMSEEFFLTKHTEPARMIFSADLLKDIFTEEELGDIRKKRTGKKIKVRAIINDEMKRLSDDKISERVKISRKEFPISSDIAIFGNKVRIATQKGDLVGLIIENKEISETLKTLFDLGWKQASLLKKRDPRS
jgi:HTH-type transcriptional regulator, sugar sensing transcriptional regulator